LQDAPTDWVNVGERAADAKHFLFYFRDNTFECVACSWEFGAHGDLGGTMRLSADRGNGSVGVISLRKAY
jgi:hypothetical protein